MASTFGSTALLALGGLSTSFAGLVVLSLAAGDQGSTLVFGGVLIVIAAISLVVGEPDPSVR